MIDHIVDKIMTTHAVTLKRLAEYDRGEHKEKVKELEDMTVQKYVEKLGYAKPSKLPKKKKRVKNERKELIKLCDQLVRTIRFKTETQCFITGVAAGRWNPQENPNGLQLSHFVTRTVFPLRWDLDNCHLTTAATNYAHENNSLPYTLAMIRHYGGNEILNTLNQKWQEYKITGKTMPTWQIREKRDELQAILDTLR